MSCKSLNFEVVCHLMSNTCILSGFRNNFAKFEVCTINNNGFFKEFCKAKTYF